jgi:hypothetical protein
LGISKSKNYGVKNKRKFHEAGVKKSYKKRKVGLSAKDFQRGLEIIFIK